jgi:tetratricopeptide (TPR) repeat protein
MEGYVVSRIEGVMDVGDLIDLTGITTEELTPILERLLGLGVLQWVEITRRPRRTSAQGLRQPEAASNPPRPSTPGTPSAAGRPSSPMIVDLRSQLPPSGPIESDDDAEIDDTRRRRINDVHSRLDVLNFYEVLGVSETSSRAEIRTAYFELAKVFHPDTMFRRRLGSFKPKMEAIFKRLTEAYEVLSKKKPREEYDAYLSVRRATQSVQDSLLGDVLPPPSGPPPDEPAAAPSTSATDVQDAARRRAAQRISRTLAANRFTPNSAVASPPPAPTTSVRPPGPSLPPPTAVREAAMRSLAHSLKQVADVTGGVDRAARHVHEGERAEQSGDLVAAANSYKLAVQLAPDRQDIVSAFNRVREAVAKSLADNYEKQARYEESHGGWLAAAKSWAKVCEGRPQSAEPHMLAAQAYLHCGKDIRRAQEFAQRAVMLAPDDPKTRTTLGRILINLGLKLNAKRELEAALKLDPKNELAKNLLRELK